MGASPNCFAPINVCLGDVANWQFVGPPQDLERGKDIPSGQSEGLGKFQVFCYLKNPVGAPGVEPGTSAV